MTKLLKSKVFRFIKNNIYKEKKIIICAFCLALALIIGRFKLILFGGTVKLTFDGIFYKFAAIIIGPFYGLLIAFLSEMLGAILNPVGNYIFLLSVTEGLHGLLVGIVWRLFDKNKFHQNKLIKLFFSLSVPGIMTNFVNSFILKHYLLWANEIFWKTVIIRLGKELIMILINIIVLNLMLDIYEKKINMNHVSQD